MSTPATPTTVEPGQIWRDNDQRTKGSGEFTVVSVVDGFARVYRAEGKRRTTRISVDRLLAGGSRGYTYLGRKK